ncbi:hypothetical protein B5K05_24745 [Rhizobium phaseoli]|uniref:hypothetical protein n=1 Tax=Rhizobium phaseoli TaxID=396 RepID=UPI00036DAEF8|nr:hypothetical protein [Rhizobium phaseoli]RDJ04381.1 hypothetical protein B5K04_24675 [Rhizobium phaseoli]RDJ06269.1 hypothetical protein B5K05_24745 [Rhizobium phaseoli]
MPAAILIGASGSGKATLAQAIAARSPDNTDVLFFDAIGVPGAEDMIREYGSGEAWQLAKTIEWMQRIAEIAASGRRVVFEGQTRLLFLAKGRWPQLGTTMSRSLSIAMTPQEPLG